METKQNTKSNEPLSGKLSFAKLIEFWEKESSQDNFIKAAYIPLKEKLANAPELYSPIEDESILEKHRELIDQLLAICIPPALRKFDYFAAVHPDMNRSIYETPAFKKLGIFESNFEDPCFNENCCFTSSGRLVAGYMVILSAFYGLKVHYEYPVIFTRIDEKTGLERHFRVRIFGWFSDIKVNGEIKPINEEEKRRIFENLDNPKVLMEIVPPEIFNFQGLFIYNAVDITDLETLSSLKFDLIGKESVLSSRKFESLQHKLRVLLKKPAIKLGLIAFPSENKDMANAMKMGTSILLQDSFLKNDLIKECKIYKDALDTRSIKIIYDINDYGCSKKLEEAFINEGIRNLLVAPLLYKEEVIGLLEIASSEPGELNRVNILKLNDVYPLFAICIESSLDDLNKSVQSVIKEKCTAIHPSVEWKFHDAALRYINKLREDIVEDMEEIVFDKVNPFYGCSDVKDSSIYRNSAIRSDLLDNLRVAQELINRAMSAAANPILEELSFRISNQAKLLEEDISSSSEVEVINFIRNEISSNFDYLSESGSEFKQMVNEYKSKLDPSFGFVYRKRKEFEDSITLLNETIATELEIQQDKAQKIIPHYFEKYKTDGVEYNMFAGNSLISDGKFNPIHLKSLRLWQLMTMCIIAKKCSELKSRLSIPLETTHLIFVQNSPITIKFLFDEKKFDVAGSYDIRHEIIKKRIDKAEIKGTGGRLASPCTIAVVYSQEAEADEYKQYFSFLKTKNYITGEVESFELADMQGVHGLKALRISVNSNMAIEKSTEDDLTGQNINASTGEYLESSKN
ncbi:MAG TPA: GAF domain-containing protein [Ignavibacteria bacterium]|nr:GAF domain-containing protein [Ignavibacteria bacterium]